MEGGLWKGKDGTGFKVGLCWQGIYRTRMIGEKLQERNNKTRIIGWE